MSKSFRRIVNGHNDKGVAIVARDTSPQEQRPMGRRAPFLRSWEYQRGTATIDSFRVDAAGRRLVLHHRLRGQPVSGSTNFLPSPRKTLARPRRKP